MQFWRDEDAVRGLGWLRRSTEVGRRMAHQGDGGRGDEPRLQRRVGYERIVRWILAFMIGALGVGGCSSSPSGSSQPPSVGSTANLVVTDQVRVELVKAGAALNHIPATDYVGLRSGQTYYAYDPATKTYWAGGTLVPSLSSTRAQVSIQDDGAYLLFERPASGAWRAYDVGLAGLEGARCPVTVPSSVLQVWGWPVNSCRPANAGV
jgi:hypothetical protein